MGDTSEGPSDTGTEKVSPPSSADAPTNPTSNETSSSKDDSSPSKDPSSTPSQGMTSPSPPPPPAVGSSRSPPSKPPSRPPSSGSIAMNVDQARKEVDNWLANHKLGEVDAQNLKILLKDYDGLKEKVSKLKSLLGRSAKAQREAKVDLDSTQKRLDLALREIDRLKQKIEKLANRPTHMELLADFETNFDRALLSVGQPGGQDTAPPAQSGVQATQSSLSADHPQESAVVDHLLMQELAESKQRIEKLEGLNSALLHRSSQLESETKDRKRERDELASKVSRLELEKRMAEMEAEHAMKAMQEKAASLEEMQMEIDLVTKASVTANVRAAQGEEMIKTVKTDKQHVQQLEAKVQALQEWALASAEAKTLAQERVRFLENQLKIQQQSDSDALASQGEQAGRILVSVHGSLVVGAGDVGLRSVELDEDHVRSVRLSERVVLRWKFDCTPEDQTTVFGLLRGPYEKPAAAKAAKPSDYLIKDRAVIGGAAGETDNAFATKNACTLLWSNVKSWVRPRTVKYQLEAVVLAD